MRAAPINLTLPVACGSLGMLVGAVGIYNAMGLCWCYIPCGKFGIALTFSCIYKHLYMLYMDNV